MKSLDSSNGMRPSRLMCFVIHSIYMEKVLEVNLSKWGINSLPVLGSGLMNCSFKLVKRCDILR